MYNNSTDEYNNNYNLMDDRDIIMEENEDTQEVLSESENPIAEDDPYQEYYVVDSKGDQQLYH